MKYKICKLQNEAGKYWYQIRYKKFLFWKWYTLINADGTRSAPQFYTSSDAKYHLNRLYGRLFYKQAKIKIVESINYEPISNL